MTATRYPEFFDEAPRLTVWDPLSAFLGAASDGMIDYGYWDAVKLAGHSCPTVAGAYLMTVFALRRLYPDGPPRRGNIEVYFPDPASSGVTGVMAKVASLLTGAAQEDGFKGIGGRFDRRNLLVFGAPLRGMVAFRRRDALAGVEAALDLSAVPAFPAMPGLLARAASGSADAAELEAFRAAWQDRVRLMLLDYADDPRLVRLSDWAGPRRPRNGDDAGPR